MVLCQLVFYKILIESDLQVSTLEWLEEIVLNMNIGSVLIFGLACELSDVS
jgi:altronate dehydratase